MFLHLCPYFGALYLIFVELKGLPYLVGKIVKAQVLAENAVRYSFRKYLTVPVIRKQKITPQAILSSNGGDILFTICKFYP